MKPYIWYLEIGLDSSPCTVKLGGSKLLKKFGVTWVHCFNLKFVFVFTEKKV